MITTTLNRIRAQRPCTAGWTKLLRGLGKTEADDAPLPYADIVHINGLDDALWCCRAEPQHGKEWRLFAVWCVRQVQHVLTDPRSLAVLDVAERYARGEATDVELNAARAAAQAAAGDVAGDAARAAAWDAAGDAARAAARAAAQAAAGAAAGDAAGDAARVTAWDAARGAAWDAQRVEFLRVVGEQK